MNPFREPQLMLFLAEARDNPDAHQVSLLAAADWCEERDEMKLAEGLRLLATLKVRPFYHQTSCGWRWYPGSSNAGHLLEKETHHQLKGWNYRSIDRFSHYTTFAGALFAVLRAIQKQPKDEIKKHPFDLTNFIQEHERNLYGA